MSTDRSVAREGPVAPRRPDPPGLAERLARLAPDQRAAATAAPGPVLCVAPAGSGKTTTLVARIAWLVGEGVDPAAICAVSFNRRAADELRDRVAAALGVGTGDGAGTDGPVRIRTFHALGLEILRDAGVDVRLADREEILRAAIPRASSADRRRLDTMISRLKLDLRVSAAEAAADPEAGATVRSWLDYEAELERRGAMDFDDLVARALTLLGSDATVLARWRERCAHLLVDEAQDLDRSQLSMAILLAAPANRVFLVGDDDQSIYGWRLADVRRLLALPAEALPDIRRVDLEVNYRCPSVVLERAVRLVERNEERFAKVIRPGPSAAGSLALAPSAADDVDRAAAVLWSWGDPGGTRAFLARTNRELHAPALACLAAGVPFRAADLVLPLEAPELDGLLETLVAEERAGPLAPLLLRIQDLRAAIPAGDPRRAAASDLLGWAAGFAAAAELAAAVADARARLADLRRGDATLVLATVHGTKGLEFDHVAVVGLDEGRFPSARSVMEADEPTRALEEERRLAYVAWTRARRSLTLVYDPGAPSPFLLEAFEPHELGLMGHRG